MTQPLLSVFICNYNHGRFLRQSIDSVLCQTFQDFQLVIIDDGSTDDSWSIIKEYAAADPRVIAQRFAQNRGANEAVARSLELCTGKYLFGRASDDYLISPSFFQRFADAMKAWPDAAGAFAGCEIIDINTNKRYATMGYRKSAEQAGGLFTYIPRDRALSEFLLYRLFIPGASAIWRRDLLDAAGGFDPGLGPQSDYFLNHALPMQNGVVEIHELAAAVRGGGESYSSDVEEETFFTRHALVERKIRALIPEASNENNWAHWRNCVIGMRFGEVNSKSSLSIMKRLEEVQRQLKTLPRKSRDPLMKQLEHFQLEMEKEYERLNKNHEQRNREALALFDRVVRSGNISV